MSHLSYPTCKAHCGLSDCTRFSSFSHERHDFHEKFINGKTCGL